MAFEDFLLHELIFHLVKLWQDLPMVRLVTWDHVWYKLNPCIYLPNPSTRAKWHTKLIFKQSLTGLNSEFSFFQTGCNSNVKEPSLLNYLCIAGGRKHIFPNGISEIPDNNNIDTLIFMCDCCRILSIIPCENTAEICMKSFWLFWR